MTTKKMPEAIARLEGWTYSESYDIPSPEGSEDFSGGYNLRWLLEDLDIEEKRSSLDEKRWQLLDSYFETPGSKPKEAVMLVAEVGGGTATVPKLVAVNRLSKAWWIDGGGGVGPTYVWNSDPQLDLELAAMGMEIDAEIGSDVVGNTRYYLLKGIC